MGLFKKVLISGVSIVAVAGVATGVGIAVNNSRHTEVMPDKGEEKPDSTTAPEMVNLQELINSIQPSNIVFKSTTQPVTLNTKVSTPKPDNKTDGRETVYAFNVTSKQLDLDEATKAKLIEKKVKVEIEITNLTNNGIALNGGNLDINLKGSFTEENETNTVKEKALTLTGFKQTSQTLTAFFKKEDDAKTTVIDLTKAAETSISIPYSKLEALNTKTAMSNKASAKSAALTESTVTTEGQMVSGLTNLFRTVAIKTDQASTKNNFTIEGEVKLSKIETNSDNESLFHLVSANANSQLKLVETKDGMKNEALVDEIIVTNLLASDIKLNVKGVEKELNDAYIKEIVDDAKKESTMSSFKYKYEEDKGLSIEVGSSSSKHSVSVVPTLVKKIQKEQKILANLVVSFGSGDNAKSYDTAVKEQLDELNASGFSFGIYIKDLMKTERAVAAADVTNSNNSLETYLKTENYSKPVDKTSLKESSGTMMPKGSFKLVELKEKAITADFELGTAKKVKAPAGPADGGPGVGGARASGDTRRNDDRLDVPEDQWENENWIGLISYSYGKEKETKTLIFSSISLIHIDASASKPVAELASK